KHDWIGPADKVSNLRPLKFYKKKRESKREEELRIFREDTQAWNQEFWRKHNDNFTMMKKEYIKENGKDKNLTTAEMGIFYKKFLDDNYRIHLQYNKSWYLKNFKILWLTVLVQFEKIFKK
ncbi:hypothetical protein HELRODRAFT_66220, partial [Helobdella robusta]|uniref:Apoptogenic protein 1, mitochondrial n=1 Tax=Helobdella robusta TaxID=6412 RepID=T1FYI6_HELRO